MSFRVTSHDVTVVNHTFRVTSVVTSFCTMPRSHVTLNDFGHASSDVSSCEVTSLFEI